MHWATQRCSRLFLLGAVDLRDADGAEVTSVLSQPRRFAILAYLALAPPGEFQRRTTIASVFWPESDHAHARGALRQALRFLRRAVGADALCTRGDDEVRLDPAACWCDATAFESAVAAGESETAVALYRGDLLDGFYIDSAPAFDDWLEPRRGRLARAYARSLERIADRCAADRDPVRALECWRTLAARSPDSGHVVLGFMRALEASGDRAGALHAAERHRVLLARELGAVSDAQVLTMVARLRSGNPSA